MNIKVLLIDDDENITALLKLTLHSSFIARFECEVTNRLSAARGILAANEINLILLDLGLPDSFDLEGLHILLDEHPFIPIVILTGLKDVQKSVRAMELGAQDFILKPIIDMDDFTMRLCHAVARGKRWEKVRKAVKVVEEKIVEVDNTNYKRNRISFIVGITGLIAALTTLIGKLIEMWKG